MMQAADTRHGDREELWVSLLRRFHTAAPSFVVWKNLDSALYGVGDIDAAAIPDEWPSLVGEFRAWAEEKRVGPVVVCNHIPGGLNLVAVAPRLPTFLEVGVKENRLWRGSSLFTIDQLTPLVITDPRAFQTLRPGAEGLLKLLLNGTRYGGRRSEAGLREKRVVELLRADREGVALAAALLGRVEGPLRRGARAAAAGRWDPPAMLAVELYAVLMNLRDLSMLARRIYFKLVRRQTCLVVKAILMQGRSIPGDKAAWLERVSESHEVYGTLPMG